jgi:hypothetical protein
MMAYGCESVCIFYWRRHRRPRLYGHCDAPLALAAFSAVRQWNLALIEGLRAADFDKPLNHPERGDMTLRVVSKPGPVTI